MNYVAIKLLKCLLVPEIPGLVLSAAVVDRVGRKVSMWAMLFTSCAFLAPLIFQRKEAMTTSLLFGARACIMGSFTVLYIYAPEVNICQL